MTPIILPLVDAKVFKLKKHIDNRGWFVETFRQSWIDQYIPNKKFIFDFSSMSTNINTIRGLHAQTNNVPQSKLVFVLNGKIKDILVDARINSPTYGQYCSVILSQDDPHCVYIPEGFYHGFITLEPNTVVHYKTDKYHSATDEVGIMYNDDTLNIDWELTHPPTISQRDLSHPTWNNAYKF